MKLVQALVPEGYIGHLMLQEEQQLLDLVGQELMARHLRLELEVV
jgi:hypothetical protein